VSVECQGYLKHTDLWHSQAPEQSHIWESLAGITFIVISLYSHAVESYSGSAKDLRHDNPDEHMHMSQDSLHAVFNLIELILDSIQHLEIHTRCAQELCRTRSEACAELACCSHVPTCALTAISLILVVFTS